MEPTVFTIGHSTYEEEYFVSLLRKHNINAVCDVRSVPYSRKNPQFNRDYLESVLRSEGIVYRFLGKELGARSNDPACYERGRVKYDRIAVTGLFKRGIERVQRGLQDNFRIALMCAEREPLGCHRSILIARYLVERNINVEHILEDGGLENHVQAMTRLVGAFDWLQEDMFLSRDQLIADAYKRQEERIAYSQNETATVTSEKV